MLRRILHAARWVLAPMYLGLILVLGMLLVVFGRELLEALPRTLELSSGGAIILALTMIDLVLVANLLLIVILSGWESYLSTPEERSPETGGAGAAGGVDFAGLKIKLIASIVAISGIELLKRFMALDDSGAPLALADPVLAWSTGIHLVFVLSATLLALSDRLAAPRGGHGTPPPASPPPPTP